MHRMQVKYLRESLIIGCESETMQTIVCTENIIETELILHILKREAASFFEKRNERMESLLSDFNTSKSNLKNINRILYRGSTNTLEFFEALMSRSIYHMRMRKFPLAIRDLTYCKSLDSKILTTEGLVLVHTLLCNCLYMNKNMHGGKFILQMLNNFDYLKVWQTNDELKEFLSQLGSFECNVKTEFKHMNCEITAQPYSFKPTGFEEFSKLFSSFDACKYVSMGNGLYTTKKISAGETVVVDTFDKEDPIMFQFSAPFLNCELCGVRQDHLFTCSNCRFKTYCSKSCMDADKLIHSEECFGYKIAIIPMLEAVRLYRMFLKATKYLSESLILLIAKTRTFNNADTAWTFIIEHAKFNARNLPIIKQFLISRPNFKLITPATHSKLIATSFRLAVYVYNETNLVETCFGIFGLSKPQTIRLMAAVFLRLSGHIAMKSVRKALSYKETQCHEASVDNKENSWNQTEPAKLAERINVNAFSYFNINMNAAIMDCFNKLQDGFIDRELPTSHTYSNTASNYRFRLKDSPMIEYMNRIFVACFKSETIEQILELKLLEADDKTLAASDEAFMQLGSSKRFDFLSRFIKYFHLHLVEYFGTPHKYGYFYQEKQTICKTIKMINHSCKGNVYIRPQENGLYIAIATEAINAGEEITVCHDANYLKQSRAQRRAYFDDLGIECNCKACKMPEMLEPTNVWVGLLCDCGISDAVTVTPAHGKCRRCHIKYTDICSRYMTFLSHINSVIEQKSQSPTDFKELLLLHGTYNWFINQHFSQQNKIRINGALLFAKFLACHGFLNHSCSVIFLLHSGNYCYLEDVMPYAGQFLPIVFEIIRLVINSYIERVTCSIKLNPYNPKMLLAIAKFVLDNHKKYLDTLVGENGAYNTFVEYTTEYNKWKKIINAHLLMPSKIRTWLSEP